MPEHEILQKLSNPLSKAEVLACAIQYRDSVDGLIRLSLNPDPEVSFRASWILENIAELDSDHFSAYMPAFLNAYFVQGNRSSKRHFTKIMMQFSSDGYNFGPEERERIIEITFDWMINEGTPVAVQVNCMDVLFNFRNDADWLRTELEEQIAFLMKDGSAAMQSRGRRLLAKLARERKVLSRSK